jgi:hypothetical protein
VIEPSGSIFAPAIKHPALRMAETARVKSDCVKRARSVTAPPFGWWWSLGVPAFGGRACGPASAAKAFHATVDALVHPVQVAEVKVDANAHRPLRIFSSRTSSGMSRMNSSDASAVQ